MGQLKNRDYSFKKFMMKQNFLMFLILQIDESLFSNICKSGRESTLFLSSWIQESSRKCANSPNCTSTNIHESFTFIVQEDPNIYTIGGSVNTLSFTRQQHKKLKLGLEGAFYFEQAVHPNVSTEGVYIYPDW